jgi:hypothetical protein
MLVPYLLVVYVVLSLYTAWLGRHRALGFWGVFVFSVLLTPAIVGFLLLVSAPRSSNGT